MATKRIAVAGAGSLGTPVVKALIDAGFAVTVLTRSSTPTKLSLGPNADVNYATVDYNSVDSLKSALQGHSGVISTMSPMSTGQQGPLVEAAKAAGVQRFLPAEYGADMSNPHARQLPVFQGKAMIGDQLIAAAASEPSFTYTLVSNGGFLDWGLEYAFLLDPKKRTATIFDDGERAFSVTTLGSVAKAVAAIFQNLDATKNRTVYIHDATITQNRLLEIAKKVDPEKKEWDVKHVSLEQTKQDAMETLGKSESQEAVMGAMVQLIWPSMVGEGYGGDFSGKTDNALLGSEGMSEKEIEEVVARYF